MKAKALLRHVLREVDCRILLVVPPRKINRALAPLMWLFLLKIQALAATARVWFLFVSSHKTLFKSFRSSVLYLKFTIPCIVLHLHCDLGHRDPAAD